MQLDQGMMIVEHFGRPARRSHLHDARLRLARACRSAHETKTLHNPQMMAVDTHRPPPEHREVHHRSAGLHAYAVELLQPRANLLRSITRQKIEAQRAASLCDLQQRFFELDRLALWKGNRPDRPLRCQQPERRAASPTFRTARADHAARLAISRYASATKASSR